jgi:hypothetical protein
MGHAGRMMIISAHKILVEKPEGKKLLRGRNVNIKKDFSEIR